MKRLSLLPLLLLAALPLAAGLRFPAPHSFRLANGLTVTVVSDPSLPLVSLRLLVPGAGSAHEAKGGVADLCAALLLKGAGGKPASAVAEEIDFLGARIDFSARPEYLAMSASTLAENLEKLLAVAGDALARPDFGESEFAKEKQNRLEELKAVKDNPAQAVRFYFQPAYAGAHPLGRMALGTPSALQSVEVADVREFYRRRLRPQGAILAVCGDVSVARLKKLLPATLGGWRAEPGEPPGPLPPLPQPQARQCLLVDKPDASQAYFVLGVPGLKMGDPRSAVSQVMNTLFGGRFTSWLNSELRIKRGLTYGARSSFESWRDNGIFTISSYTRNEKIGEMLEIALAMADKARREGFAEDEITSARNYILGQFPPSLESLAAQANAYATLAVYGLGFDYYAKLLDGVAGASRAEVNRLAAALMPADQYVLVVVGKAEEIRGQLARFGEFKEKKISDPDF